MGKINMMRLMVWGRRLLVSGIIFTGLLFFAARLLLPDIASYREEIETLAAEILESPVTIEHIESGWAGLRPVISLTGVQMQQAGDKGVLRFDSLKVVLGVIPSLLSGELRPRTIYAHMQNLELHRSLNGQLSINLGGLADSTESSIGKEQLDWILQQPDLHIDIDTFVFSDRMNKIPIVNLNNVGVDFVNQSEKLVARLKTKGSKVAEAINLTVSLDPEQLVSGKYNAELYLQLKAASLSFWKKVLAHAFYLPDEGNTDVSVWIKLDERQVKQVNGSLSIEDLVYKKTDTNDDFSIESMASGFNWQVTQPGWKLQLKNMHFQRSGVRWPESSISVEYKKDDSNRFIVNADYLKVQDFLPLIDRQPLVHFLYGNDLQLLSPAGEVNDLKLQFSIDEKQQLGGYALQTKVVNFSVNAHEQWPGVKGLDGYVVATDKAGLLQLSTTNALLDLPTTFRDPVRLDTLQGDISWTWLASGLLIESAQLDADNNHLSTQSRLSVHVPTEGEVIVDLQTNFRDGDAAYTSFYLPISALGEETLAWLDKNIIAGQIEYGSFILHGALEDFPFDDNNGRFEVRFKVRDGVLDYYEDWPRIHEVEAEVAFVGREMRIEASSGKIFEAELRDTVAEIKDLEIDNPVLSISGKAKTPSSDLFKYLETTKLSGDFQAALSALTMQGMHDLDIEIVVPTTVGDPTVKGQLSFLDNNLNIESWGLHIDKINGFLDFTEQSFSATDIKAVFDDREATVQVETILTLDDPETHINLQGRADLAKLIKPKNKVLASQFSGDSPFEVLINIPDKAASQLTINSSLFGTALKFPHPLGKLKDEKLGFSLNTGFVDKAGLRLEMTLGERLQAAFLFDADTRGLDSAYVQLGSKRRANQPLDHKGLIVGGRLDYLDLDEWKRWVNQLGVEKKDRDFSLAFSTELNVDRLKYAQWFVDDFSIKASSSNKDWHADISGEGAAGLVSYSNKDKASILNIDFQHMIIGKWSDEKKQTESETNSISTLKPSDVPEMKINIDKLIYDKRELGQLKARTKLINKNQHRLEEVNLQSDETRLMLTGDWLSEDDEGHEVPSTSMTVNVESSDFGLFMNRLGYEDTVRHGKASLQADLAADASPMNFEISKLSGEVQLSITKGEVVEIDPGSAGRIFGLLSFQALPRRLSLDFTDIFNKGMSFDKIEGGFTISRGQAYTNNLVMAAPSSQVEVSGRIGLVDEDYDQFVRVIPNLSSTLPIAGALAGGPGLAVVMLVTHHLLQKPIDELTEFEYQVTGNWKSPEIVSITDKHEPAVIKPQKVDDKVNDDS